MTRKPGQTSPSGRESAAAIEEAAAAWAARAARGPLTDREQAELDAWAAQDPRRAGAYARALAVNAYLDRARALGPGFRPNALPVARALQRRRLLIGGGATAAATLFGAIGYGVVAQSGRIATRKGDIRRAPLSDGSAVTLNTDTVLRATYDRRIRKVVLLRGEALFDVAKDASRPFIVTAGAMRVRAIGTSFLVRTLSAGQVEVVVREGVVEVWRTGQEGRSVRLSAQTKVEAGEAGRLSVRPVTLASLDRALAWREGFIDLDGMTLGAAVAEFARYSGRRIDLDNPALADMKVTGRFSATDPDGFANAAALSLGLKATATADGMRLTPP